MTTRNTAGYTVSLMRNRAALVAVVLVCLAVSGGAQQPDRVRGVAGPGQAPAYLALGDSYPYGSDGSGFLPNNDNFWRSYADFLHQFLDRPLVNAGCPGETATSFLGYTGSSCDVVKDAGLLHVDYTGSQMDFAETYLTTHFGVVLVTVQLGGNDFQEFVAACQGSVQCILGGLPGFLTDLATNVDTIFSRIRNTGYAGPLILVEYPATNYQGLGAQLQALIYPAVEPVVLAYGGQMAPVFERFQLATEPYGGDSCAAGLLIMEAGGACNIHPTDAGHQLISDVIAEVLAGGLP